MNSTLNSNLYNIIFSSLFLIFGEIDLEAQNKNRDSTFYKINNALRNDSIYYDVNELDEVIISTPMMHYLPEQVGTDIFAGKKSEIISLKNINANLAVNTTRQIYARVPGLTVWENDGSGVQINISARGLSPNRSWEFYVRQNGYDITPDIYGYPEVYFSPPPNALDQIKIVRGAASLQYGTQFGGFINYILKKAPKDKKFSFETQNAVGTKAMFSSYTSVSGTIKKLNYFAYYDYRRGNGLRKNSSFLIHNAHLHLGYSFSEKVTLNAEMSRFVYSVQMPGGLTDSMFAKNSKESVRGRNWFGTPWWLWAANVHAIVSKNVTLDWKINGLIGQRNSVGIYSPVYIPDTISAITQQYSNRQVDRDAYVNVGTELRTLTKYSILNQQHGLSAGFRYYHANTNRRQIGVGSTGTDFDVSLINDSFPRDLIYTTQSFALFAENIFHVTKNFSMTPGIRYEFIYINTTGRVNIINGIPVPEEVPVRKRSIVLAGLGLDYKLLHSTSLYFNIAQAFRPIYFVELTPTASTIVVDQKLKDASGFNLDFGYRGVYRDFLSFDVGGFFLLYNNRIGVTRKYLNDDPTQATYQYRTNLGSSRSAGIEAFIEFDPVKAFAKTYKYGTLSIFASLGYTNAKYNSFNVDSAQGVAPNQVIVPVNLKGKRVEFAPLYNNRLGITYSIKGFSTTFQAGITGDSYTDAINTELPNPESTIGKLKGYTVLDLACSYQFLEKFNVKAGINNLTNKKYATRRAGGYPGPGLLPADGLTWFISMGIKF